MSSPIPDPGQVPDDPDFTDLPRDEPTSVDDPDVPGSPGGEPVERGSEGGLEGSVEPL